jgi:NAD(P)-dependent dehydrogenase (short-subunit alcohol dehydrogenase family)
MEVHGVDLEGRVVVVVGGSRGLGRAFTAAFLEHGARVVSTSRSWSGLDDFREQLNAHPEALTVELDVRNEEQVRAAYQATMERFGTIDVLINNASMRQRDLYPPLGRTTILETRADDWRRMFEANVFGTLNVTQRFITPMLEQHRGSIVNIGSTGVVINAERDGVWTALRPNSREQPYMASKSALMNLSLYLADEVRDSNIAVNTVFPSYTRTTGFEEAEAARRAQGIRGATPLEPEHVVPIVLHLAGQDAHGETGKVFDAVRWNEDHGYGGADAWRRPVSEEG